MKFFVWLISAVNVYFGLRCSLNAIGVLQTSKYSQTSTVIFAILFLSLGIAGFYVSIFQGHPKLALLISFGPWVLGFVILFVSLITGKQQ
jgi:hypothetical protein